MRQQFYDIFEMQIRDMKVEYYPSLTQFMQNKVWSGDRRFYDNISGFGDFEKNQNLSVSVVENFSINFTVWMIKSSVLEE